MTADQLLRLLGQVVFLSLFVLVLIQALRRPWRTRIDTALFFGTAAFIVVETWVVEGLGLADVPVFRAITVFAAMALPCLLLRLLNDFAGVPWPVMRFAEAMLLLIGISLVLVPEARPPWLTLTYVLYFTVLQVYVAISFVREAERSGGVARRRMQTVALGSLFLGLTIIAAGVASLAPNLEGATLASRGLALVSAVAYFLGFAPPLALKRSWQEPELRAFLGRAASLPRLPDTGSIVAELESGAAGSLGAADASIGLWDEATGRLRFRIKEPIPDDAPAPSLGLVHGDEFVLRPAQMLAGRSFSEQLPIFSTDPTRDDPTYSEVYRGSEVAAVLAAPITAGDRRLGVLVVYTPRAPIFAEDDLELIQLLADQAAVILESRALIDEAARVRAREEATRLKDDFLSAAAHDLKTPLTTLVAQAQLLERSASLKPEQPPDLAGIRRLVAEGNTLRNLVLELLDAARAEQGRLVGARELVDLGRAVEQASSRHAQCAHRLVVEAEERVVGYYDEARIGQLLDNLVENGMKYSPQGSEVRLKVWREGEGARISVTDFGIGIPREDLHPVFERFHRASNVDDRRFAGMGLGLYICRAIAEQHGGTVWAESDGPASGSTIHVLLPLAGRDDTRPVDEGA